MSGGQGAPQTHTRLCPTTLGFKCLEVDPLLQTPCLELHRGKVSIFAYCDLLVKAQMKFVMFLSLKKEWQE